MPLSTHVPFPSVLVALAGAALTASAARADTIVLKSGKRIEDVVVSRKDSESVVINRFHSRNPDMVWGIEDKDRIPADKVAEVIYAEPPLVQYREFASIAGHTAAEHVEMAAKCEAWKLKEERLRELRLALCIEPDDAAALAELGKSAWTAYARGNPEADPELRRLEHEYVQLTGADELEAQWKQMAALGTKRKQAYLERARRSFAEPRGRRDQQPITLGSEETPGATFCLYVPKSYDPLVPTALLISLHGGGRGGTDPTLVTGSGEAAMNWCEREAEEYGLLVACPTAKEAPWAAKANEPLIDNLLLELCMRFNVDQNRIYLSGHSMGGFGTWHHGPRRADVWAACSPNAGGGGPNGIASKGVPIFIYHGTDDNVVGVGGDRSAAESLLGDKSADFVYTELDHQGHGWPDAVRKEMFRFFLGRWKDAGKRRATEPRSSFDEKVGKDEVRAFGDPSKPPQDADTDAPALKPLLEALRQGGGKGRDAVTQLASHHDAASVKAVAKILKSSKSSVDSRVLAAEALGGMGGADAVKPLVSALDDEDYRVLDASTASLGRVGLPDAVQGLVRAGKRMGERFEGSFYESGRMVFTEYGVRLASFGLLCDALGAGKDAETALPVLEREVVERVFTRKERIDTGNDARFVAQPPADRIELVRKLGAALVALADARGAALLLKLADAWKDEPRLEREAREAAAKLPAE